MIMIFLFPVLRTLSICSAGYKRVNWVKLLPPYGLSWFFFRIEILMMTWPIRLHTLKSFCLLGRAWNPLVKVYDNLEATFTFYKLGWVEHNYVRKTNIALCQDWRWVFGQHQDEVVVWLSRYTQVSYVSIIEALMLLAQNVSDLIGRTLSLS